MGGGGTETTTQTSGLANKSLDTAVSTIGANLNSALGKGQAVFGESMYAGLSPETRNAALSLSNNPNNSIYGQGITDAIGQQSRIAAGDFGNDPARTRLINDVSTNTNAILQGSGRFGSGSHEQALIDNVGGSLAQYDYGRQQQAIQNLPQLYSASLAPASAALTGGQILDADLQAALAGRADLFDRKNNASWNDLARGTSILAGAAPAGGTTTSTTSPTAPWWQQGLGAAAIGSGIYKNIWGS